MHPNKSHNGESRFPDLWKKAQVNTVPKNKNIMSFKDFRPINLLFHLGKVAETIILSRMRQRMDAFHNKFAYTPGLRTTDASSFLKLQSFLMINMYCR